MRNVALAGLLLLCGLARAGAAQPLDPHDGAVLPSPAAKNMLDQCSREAPRGVTDFWTPSQSDIVELEARLPSALDAAIAKGGIRERPDAYQRQYAGIVIGGRRVIYVNAFPKGSEDPEPGSVLPWRKAFDWHTQVMSICDGGPDFFGAQFDLATKTFSHFAFNGVA